MGTEWILMGGCLRVRESMLNCLLVAKIFIFYFSRTLGLQVHLDFAKPCIKTGSFLLYDLWY